MDTTFHTEKIEWVAVTHSYTAPHYSWAMGGSSSLTCILALLFREWDWCTSAGSNHSNIINRVPNDGIPLSDAGAPSNSKHNRQQDITKGQTRFEEVSMFAFFQKKKIRLRQGNGGTCLVGIVAVTTAHLLVLNSDLWFITITCGSITWHKRIVRKVDLDCTYDPTSHFSLIPTHVQHLHGIFISVWLRAFQLYVVLLW